MTLKLSLNNQIHRISKLPTSHKALRETVTYIFGSLLPAKWTLQYLDSDGDTIMLSDETDFRTLLDDELANSSRSVKVFVKILEDNEQMPQNWEAVVVTQSEESQVIGTDEPKIKSEEIYIDNPERLEVSEACCIPAASQNQVDKSLTIEDGTICLRQDYVEPQSNDHYIMKRSLQKLVSVSMKKEKLEAELAAFGQNMTSNQAEKLQKKMDKYVRQLADEKMALKVKLSEETLAILYRELLADLNKEFTITQKPTEDNIQDVKPLSQPKLGQSSDRPALITTPNNELLMLYKGSNDYKVYVTFSSDGGFHWLPEAKINDKVNTLSGPGIAFCYSKYHLVFRGVENRIYYSASDYGFTWDDPIPLAGLTSDSPALTVYNNQLFLAWKGATSDTAMWYSTYNNTNNTWSTQAVISSAFTTPNGPTLISYNNTVGLGFRGTDDNLYYATYTNASWSSSAKINGKTSDKPYLALLTGNILVMMWKSDISNFINYSRSLSTGWTPQVQITTSITTGSGPALTSADDGPHLIYRGTDGNLNHASGPLIYDYFSVNKVSGFFSSDRPALIQYGDQINNQLLTIFKSNSSLRMSYSIYSDATWTPPTMLDATLNTANAPALIFHNATYHLVYQGSNKPDNIYHSFSPSGTSFKTCYATPFSTSDTPALAVYNDQLVLLWKGGADNDTTMWYSTFNYDNRLWNPQKQLDTSLRTSSGPALMNYNATLHLAYRGTDDFLYYTKNISDLTSWNTPIKIANNATTSCKPTLSALDDNNELYVFWKNVDDTNLFSSSSLDNGNTWSARLLITTGVNSKSAPAFVPGKSTSYLLYQGTESDGPLSLAIGTRGVNLSTTNVLRSNKNWMEYLYNTSSNFKNKKLAQIIIPGTHDSGCSFPTIYFPSSMKGDSVMTQLKPIFDQLTEGIRYFDLKFCLNGGSFVIYHEGYIMTWSTLSVILAALKSFIQANTMEFIILHITHFGFNDSSTYQTFFDQIWASIGNFTIPNFTGTSDTRTIDNLLQATGRVVISTDADPVNIPSQYKSNIWNNILSPYDGSIYRTNNPNDIKIEIDKQIGLNSNKGYLWVAQLTMTPLFTNPLPIKTLSMRTNSYIDYWMTAWKGNVNIVTSDYYWGSSYVDKIVTLNQSLSFEQI